MAVGVAIASKMNSVKEPSGGRVVAYVEEAMSNQGTCKVRIKGP